MKQLLLLLCTFFSFAQVSRIEPPNWWTGMKNNKVQLLVQHKNIQQAQVSINNKSITIEAVHKADSPNYLFIDLAFAENTPSGAFVIEFKMPSGKKLNATYELKERTKKAEDYIGFSSKDVIYLITPDRFANGNPKNDSFKNLKETAVNRKDDYARHGGDLQGITNHVDYIANMGFTQIWPCPVLTNDMYNSSYHGYAMTNFYEVDPRFGTLDEYKQLAIKADEKGLGLIMDQVANHCGLEHWWMSDLPFKDWVNYQENYEKNRDNWGNDFNVNSNHRRTTNQDAYAAKTDKELMNGGWFVPTMPDLNQRNPFMAKYLIQNSIWWVETLGLSGIRQDTYPYPDKAFMSNWAGAIMTEYPNFNIVGEEVSTNPLLIGYWQADKKNKEGNTSNLKSTMDFAMQKAIVDALNEPEQWDKGLVKIYEGLANDFAYASPQNIMAFPDNHDMSRIFTQLKGDITNTKIALSHLLVLPRIPQIYYGTEILMNDFDKPGDHGLIRTDFPGGWAGDSTNAFTGYGLSPEAKIMQNYLTTLLNYRKNSNAIHKGSTLHFAPDNGVYVLTRTFENETVVYILNKNEKAITLNLDRFKELNLEGKPLKDIFSNLTFIWEDKLKLPVKGSYIFTTKK
jgi:neopullulanase